MNFARALLPLALAAIVGLAGVHADANSRSKRPPAAAATPDEAFVQARNAAAQSDRERFEAAAAQARGHPLSAYLDYWQLRLRLGALRAANRNGASGPLPGSGGEIDAEIRAFADRNDGTLVADLLRRDWLLDLGRRGAWQAFDEQYARWVLRDDAQVHCYAWLGELRSGKGLSAQAREALFQPRELGAACGSLLEALARDGTLTRAQLWRRLKLALEANAQASVRKIASLIDLQPGAVEAALQRPEKVVGSAAAPEIELIAAVQIARKDPEAAGERLGDLRRLDAAERAFVVSQIAAHSMRKLAERSLDWARHALELAGQARPQAPIASDDTWVWLARAALRGGDWATLQASIAQMSAAGRADPAWVYWNARADRALGRPDQANEQLATIAGQFHFYGQLAAEDLGRLVSLPKAPPAPGAEELAAAARNAGFARAIRFYELGLRFDGNREWNYQLRTMTDRQLIAASEWACRRAILDRCVNTAERTVAEHDFALRFITPFRELLAPVAEERGLDQAWIYGLIRQESRFLLDARSSASAQGLMQIIPPTARWIARKLGVADFRIDHLNDMATNLRFGTFYLKSVFEDLDGSPVLASAAYNAGPNRPRRWRSTLPAAVEGAVFAEIIPFHETRDYVKKVMSNATIYSTLMTGEPQSLKARLGSVAPAEARPSALP